MCRAQETDIALVNKKGRKFHAEILSTEQVKKGGKVTYHLKPLQRGITYLTCDSREIEAVWRKLKS